jgi:hypothetical protein
MRHQRTLPFLLNAPNRLLIAIIVFWTIFSSKARKDAKNIFRGMPQNVLPAAVSVWRN